jgi:hypothetical protein
MARTSEPGDDPLTSKQRAVLAFLVGAASVSSAGGLAHSRDPLRRRKRVVLSKAQRRAGNVTFLALYLCLAAGAVLGWQLRPDAIGLGVGVFLGTAAAPFLWLFGWLAYVLASRVLHRRR